MTDTAIIACALVGASGWLYGLWACRRWRLEFLRAQRAERETARQQGWSKHWRELAGYYRAQLIAHQLNDKHEAKQRSDRTRRGNATRRKAVLDRAAELERNVAEGRVARMGERG